MLRRAGEDGELNDRALLRLIDALPGLPDAAQGVELPRMERSLTAVRGMPVIRAWRASALRGYRSGSPVIEGRTVLARTVELAFDRSRLPDLSGHAERCERKKDWMEAHRAWELQAEGDSPWAAYARMRCALMQGMLLPESTEVRALLGQAWAMCPGLPEAGVRLAGWWLARGQLREALLVAEMADAALGNLAPVPQLDGGARWSVPARLAEWLAKPATTVAAGFAARALERDPPEQVRKRMEAIASAQSHSPQPSLPAE